VIVPGYANEIPETDSGGGAITAPPDRRAIPGARDLGRGIRRGPEARCRHLWLVDPIDGTASFAIGLPLFGTPIGFVRRGGACVGAIGAHALGETVYAAAGQGDWLRRNGSEPQRVWTSAVADPTDALVVSTALEHTDLDPRDPSPSVCLSRLYRQARRFRWSGDCVNYALLCQGWIDVALDLVRVLLQIAGRLHQGPRRA